MSTISKLATDTILTKSYYAGRTHPIDGIIIHHMGSIQTARSCASSFNALPYSASSNYCVGNAGDICCSMPEENAAITSNSYEYDNRSITIEISNSARNGQWPVGDKAMEANCSYWWTFASDTPELAA